MKVGDLVKNIMLFEEYTEVGIVLENRHGYIRVQWNGSNSERGDYCYQSWHGMGEVSIIEKSLNKS